MGKRAERLSRFGEYLKKHGVKRDDIAAAVECTPSYISMLAHGQAKAPGFKLARKIAAWTKTNAPVPFECENW